MTGKEVTLKLEHRGQPAPTPVTVTLNYASGESDSLVIPVLERTATRTVKLKGALRDAQVNQDFAALAEFGEVSAANGLLRQIDSCHARFAVAFEGLEYQDEARARVVVEPRQAFAQTSAIDILPPNLGRAAEPRRHRHDRFADSDFLAVEKRQDRDRHRSQRYRGRNTGDEGVLRLAAPAPAG